MLVLFLAILLLIVCPALLLWIGKLIEARLGGRRRRRRPVESSETGSPSAWYRTPMRPAFTWPGIETPEDAGTPRSQ